MDNLVGYAILDFLGEFVRTSDGPVFESLEAAKERVAFLVEREVEPQNRYLTIVGLVDLGEEDA